jgi:hypothetical protein
VIVLRTASQLRYYKKPWARGYCGCRTVARRVREPAVCVTPTIKTKRRFCASMLVGRFPAALTSTFPTMVIRKVDYSSPGDKHGHDSSKAN